LPSGDRAESDGHLIVLRKNNPATFRRVISGELTLIQARREAGMKVDKVTNLGRAKSAIGKLSLEELSDLLTWMKDAGLLD